MTSVKTSTTSSPEYLTSAQVRMHFGLGKGYLYSLLNAGRIRAAAIKSRPNSVRPKRLWHAEDIRSLITSSLETGSSRAQSSSVEVK